MHSALFFRLTEGIITFCDIVRALACAVAIKARREPGFLIVFADFLPMLAAGYYNGCTSVKSIVAVYGKLSYTVVRYILNKI